MSYPYTIAMILIDDWKISHKIWRSPRDSQGSGTMHYVFFFYLINLDLSVHLSCCAEWPHVDCCVRVSHIIPTKKYVFLFIHDDARIARWYFSAPAHTEPQPACKFKLKLTMKFPCKINSATPNISIYICLCAPHSLRVNAVSSEKRTLSRDLLSSTFQLLTFAKSHSRRTYRRETYIYEVQIHLFTSHCVNGWQKINTLHTCIPALVGPIATFGKMNGKSIRPEKIAHDKDIKDKRNDILILLPPSSSILTFSKHKKLCSHEVRRTQRYEFRTAAFAANLRFPRLKTWNSFIFVLMPMRTEQFLFNAYVRPTLHFKRRRSNAFGVRMKQLFYVVLKVRDEFLFTEFLQV